jgi:hypothetical protein
MWQAAHPMFVKTCCPVFTDVVDAVEVLDVVVEEAAADMAELAVAAATCVEEPDAAVGVVLDVAGVGGARRRMNIAKLVMSEE